jgi:tetratricopeptide (TPR) repeat protein
MAPAFELAADNLDDLDSPIEEREGAFPFASQNWIESKTLEDVFRITKRLASSPREALDREMRNWIKKNPKIENLVPHLLDRADPMGRHFALMMVDTIRSQALVEAARDFALGQRGSDQSRMKAAQIAKEAGLLSRTVRIWQKGEWREVRLFGFRIDEEPNVKHGKAALKLALKGWELMQERDWAGAEQTFREALEVEPDSPDLLQNLCGALASQGKETEGMEVLERIVTQFPFYVSGRVTMAKLALRAGDPEKAGAILDPLEDAERMHVDDFQKWVTTQIDVALELKDRKRAETWLNLGKGALGGDGDWERYERLIKKPLIN